jgi:3-dehydroquinate dehydratase/shikimate dehydrogenase
MRTEPICVVVGRTRHKMMQIELQEAAKRGAQLIEIRFDFLGKAADFKRLLANRPCELIATCRRPADGGRWPGTEEERLMLLRQAIAAGFDWVDLETDVADKIPRFGQNKRIISYHNLREVPDDLQEIYAQMCEQDADVVKLAVTAQNPLDNLKVLKLLQKQKRPTVAFCMGDFGVPSRILGAKFGAAFTYAAFNKERGIAPGIPSYDEIKRVYHYDRIGPETTIFAVVGDPIAHSLSPLIHNAAFRELGFDAVYVPFRVLRGHLEEFVRQFDRLPIQGYSVTIPHKEAAAHLAHTKEPEVAIIHAANTLVRQEEGFLAANTDFHAAKESLAAQMPLDPDGSPTSLHSRSVLVLGAGGVARAVAHALHRDGALVAIASRSAEKTHQLAEEVGCRAVDWEARHNLTIEILINCTPVGMHPNLDEMPIHSSFLRAGLMVMDCVYTPETTLLIKEARSRGCHVITGVDMFVRQAALQFQIFTGESAPLDLMWRLVKNALSPVNLSDEE